MNPALLALLDAVRDAPDDDLPRMALADWLAEQPDPTLAARGEFVRLQWALRRLPSHDPRRVDVERQARELRQLYEGAWVGDLAGLADHFWFDGGLTGLTVSADPQRGNPVPELAASPAWPWVVGLALHAFEPSVILEVVRSDAMGGLNSLHVSTSPLGAQGAQTVAGSPHLRRLVSLGWQNNALDDSGMRSLAESEHLTRLTELDLRHNEMGREAMRSLAQSAWRPVSLNLEANRVDAEGARLLAGSAVLDRLVFLDVGANHLGPEGASALAGSPRLARLRQLQLHSNQLGDAGATAVADSPHFRSLVTLDLSGNGIGNEGAAALARSANLARLEVLNLKHNAIDDAGALALALERILMLDLRHNPLGPEARRALEERFGERVLLSMR